MQTATSKVSDFDSVLQFVYYSLKVQSSLKDYHGQGIPIVDKVKIGKERRTKLVFVNYS